MPPKQPAPEKTPPAMPDRQRLWSAIRRNVIRLLGEPTFEHRLDIRELWEGHCRVNVLVGGEMGSVRILHSYFLATDSEGNIVEANPRIVRHY